MADKFNVNSSVPLETLNVNPTMGSNASVVNPLLVGEVPIVVPSVATTTLAINSFVRNMPDPMMGQYTSQGNVPMANPYMNSVPLSMNHTEKPVMEIESATQHKGAWGWLKALPSRFKAKVISVAKSIKKLAQDDPRRIIHSLKVGLALTMVSLLYYVRPLYDGFGVSGMWAVLTVVVVFEFTVACALGIGAKHLASLSGEKGEPIILGILVFLLAAASTFTRFFPKIKARYDYGILIFILTFSMISVSGSRVEDLLEMSHQRLSTILIGGAICIIVSIFVCPNWAGQDLHKLVASNIDKLATYLEEFGGEYFQNCSENEEESCGGGDVSKNDKSFLQGYKSVLNSKNTEESLANFARWEPAHGRFRLRHPWKQYLKIGALARQCAYNIEALNVYIGTSDTKVSPEFNGTIQDVCMKMSSESGKALKELASAIKTMSDDPFSSANAYVESSKTAANELKIALESASLNNVDIQAILPSATVASTLIEIVSCVEKISEAVHELSNLAHFKKIKEANVSPELSKQPHNLLHRGSVNPVLDGDSNHVVITIDHETTDHLPENDQNPKGPNPAGLRPQL
ncbi:hypothetical protein EZV62_015965 [Acer yangbiense]|uniref:Aluminum-activated malate transporter n=1 Tax=Acer yangbiense TaxID=1000413 RepID=A0A5C7HPA3_9ROSI|nr:hypothetical protein EZV62_015965 [Acer yangbiense]